ncbi:MAG: protein kinase, partial [Proteobacteria bacterium]|nr:protein kinase [Pseudomonadota bacterium]
MKINPNEIKIWQQATEVLEKLLDLPVDDALEKLGRMSGLDEKIKQAVIQLLKATSQDSQILIDQVSNSINDHSNPQQICQIGDIFGDYKLEKLIGQGGMSCIYMAKHINADIQKPVAIKIFLHANTSEKLLQHFINEQMILASLNHENIVSLHHGGTSNTGIPYLVMDYLHDAQLIDEYCKKNALSVQQILTLCAQVADALAYAHGQLIVHRDLKPGNILIDQNGMPKVVDFGIARLLSEGEACNNNTLFALTPSYASPEQINGQEISVRSDVFSMSAVILNLISNKEPLPVDRMFKACRSDSAYIRTLLGKLSVDQDLKNIVNKGLQNEPKRRYSTMTELASDIGRWRDQRPVHATPDSVLYRTRKFIMRRTALFASLLTLVFSLVFGIMALFYQSDKTRLEAEKANQVKDFMLDVFAVTHPDQAQGEVVTALNLLDTAQAELESERHDSLELKAELMTATGIAYGQLGAWAKSIDILSKSLEIDSTNEETIINLAKFQINSGDEEGARKTLVAHRELLDKMLNNSSKSSYFRIQAKMAASNSEFEQSQGFIDQALKIDTENQDTLSIISDQRLQAEHLFFQS